MTGMYICHVIFYLWMFCRCCAQLDYELLDPEERYSERMYSTVKDDLYVINYNLHDGTPDSVWPWFPASLGSPDLACQQLYAHLQRSPADQDAEIVASRVVWSAADTLYLAVQFRARHLKPRNGIQFGCKLRPGVELDGEFPWRLSTLKWFMSCDEFKDQHRAHVDEFWRYPMSTGYCVPIDAEKEHKEREAKRIWTEKWEAQAVQRKIEFEQNVLAQQAKIQAELKRMALVDTPASTSGSGTTHVGLFAVCRDGSL